MGNKGNRGSELLSLGPQTNNCEYKDNNSTPEDQMGDLHPGVASLINGEKLIEEEEAGVGMLTIKSANQWAQEAASKPNPRPLWKSLWYEGEVCLLFADSNVGKSILGVQIGNEIAASHRVLYCDFELSGKQFQLRYTSDGGILYNFPGDFFRAEIDPFQLGESDDAFEERIITDIEEAAIQMRCKVVIIDNITVLNSKCDKGDHAGTLMLKLMGLKKKHDLSMLILAHTPKRPLTSPISQNDLAGSKRLMNFCDSSFAVGFSAKGENKRYIKQIKCRNGSFEYGADNVISAEILKEGSFTRFILSDCGKESEHLQEPRTRKELSEEEKKELGNQIQVLQAKGRSFREIASELGFPTSTIFRIANNNKLFQ